MCVCCEAKHSFITPLELAASKQGREGRIFKEKGYGSKQSAFGDHMKKIAHGEATRDTTERRSDERGFVKRFQEARELSLKKEAC